MRDEPVRRRRFLERSVASAVGNARFDRFTLPNREINLNGVGVFFLKNGMIAEWSDYTIR
jgi:limonene-1,2-epoxide hydrolase